MIPAFSEQCVRFLLFLSVLATVAMIVVPARAGIPNSTPTPTATPIPPTPLITRIAKCEAPNCPEDSCLPEHEVWSCGAVAVCPRPTNDREVRACCYTLGGTNHCAFIPCSVVIQTSLPCHEARAINADYCGIFEIPDCHPCLQDEHCQAYPGTSCIDGVCQRPDPTPTVTIRPSCRCDCDGSSSVTVNELVVAVNIALGQAPASACASADMNDDGAVSISELIGAVGAALNGC